MSGENYRSATKSHDPGWNDPPKLGYSPSVASPGQPTKLNLNKRVAFPVATANSVPPPPTSGESSLPQFIPAASGPPPPVSTSSNPQHIIGTPPKSKGASQTLVSQETCSSQDSNEYPAGPEMLLYVSETLEKCVLNLETPKQADIRKRLSAIERSWTEEKLSQPLAQKLYRFAQALTDCKATEANEIHRSIVVDHGRDCVQWAPALRQLVMTLPKPDEVLTEETIMKPI
ncbi:steroid receptor RNA activator 1-like [Wyeomyia smithii]|uniref:steroid receptor RNA activator 1-like n=1 Tax=Wyeomyia smithii TaxID=174621 RepID=UPI002467C5DD|nr:steroid receptor RNA activator 1-like [Wyeomyia smithii]